MVTSQTMTETHSSTMQSFESVSTVMMSSTSVKSIEVQQVTSVEEYSTSPVLTLKMSDVIVSLGDVAQFNCSFSGQPFTEIVWDHNGRTITNTERVQYAHQAGLISLVILYVHLGDQGSYCCTVKNRNGESRTSAQLTVEAKEANPKETPVPSDSISKSAKTENESSKKATDQEKVESLQNVGALTAKWQISHQYNPDVMPLLECDKYDAMQPEFLVKLSPEFLAKQKEIDSIYYINKGSPSPFIVWLYNQLNVEVPRSYSLKHDGPLCCLNVKNVITEQGGSNSCKVINAAGDKTCSTHLKMKTVSTVDEEASYEEEAKVFSTLPIPTKEDSCATSLHLKEQTFELQPKSKLFLESIKKKPEKPVFVTKFSSEYAALGETAKFTVIVSGFPKPIIQWYHNGNLIHSSSFYTFVQEKEEHTLVITQITKELEGEYSCTASNQFGKSTCTSYLNIKVKDTKKQEETIGQPPYFIKEIEDIQCAVGSQALFEYTVAGSPLPDVHWYRGSNHMQPSKYCIIVNNADGSGYLKMLGIQQSDSGTYSCKATNPYGEISCCAKLIAFLETVSLSESYSVSLSEVKTTPQQERKMDFAIVTEGRQTLISEQIDTLQAFDISAASLHREQVTHQAAVLQSYHVQEEVKPASAQTKPVVATSLKQLPMTALTSAVQENQGFTEQHCDRIASPEVRQLELSVEETSNLMSAVSESITPVCIIKSEDLIKSEKEKMHTTFERGVIVSGPQVEMKLPIPQEQCIQIKSPEEEKSYSVTEGVKLLYSATSSENVVLTEVHTSELATMDSTQCLVEKEQTKPVLTSVSDTKHTLLKEKTFKMHRPVEETAQLCKDSILKSALITEENKEFQADKATEIPGLEQPISVCSQRQLNQVLHLQLNSDQDTFLSEGRFTSEKLELEQVDVRKVALHLHAVSTDDQKTVSCEHVTQFASNENTVVGMPREELPAQLHLPSVQSKKMLCKEEIFSFKKPDEQKAIQRQEKKRKLLATKEDRVELTSDYIKDLDMMVEGLKIVHKTEAKPLSVLQVVSQPVMLLKESPIVSEVKPHSAVVQKEDWWNNMHAASISMAHAIEEGLTDSFPAVDKFTCKTDVESKVPVQSIHIEEKAISTEICLALEAAEQDFAVQIQEGQSVRQSIHVEEKHTLTGETSQGFTRSEKDKINITSQPLEPILVSESQESRTLPKELTFVIPAPKSHSLDIKQQLKMTLKSAVACDQPLILADVVQSLGIVEVMEVKVRMELKFMMFTYLITTAGPPMEITIALEGEYPQTATLKNELHAAFYSMLNQEGPIFSSEDSNILTLDRPERLQVSKASSYPLSSAVISEKVEVFATPKMQSAAVQTESHFFSQSARTQKPTSILESSHHETQKTVESKMESYSFIETEHSEIKSGSVKHLKRDVPFSDITVDVHPCQITVEESMNVLDQEDKKGWGLTEDISIKQLPKELFFEVPLSNITTQENSKVTFSVKIKGVKSVNWLLNGVLFTSGKEFKCLKDNDSYTLVINKVIKTKHEGEYTCEAVSEAGKISSSSRLTVFSRGWLVWILSYLTR